MATATNDYGYSEFVIDRAHAHLRITSTPYIPEINSMSTVELGGTALLLTTDEMVELHAQLARSLGYIG